MPQKRDPTKPFSREFRGATRMREIITLPAGGSDLPVPPIPARCESVWDESERDRWRQLWESPQAVMWDESVAGMVASVVSYETLVYSGKAAAWVAAELRKAYEQLGLTPASMKSLGWRIQSHDNGSDDGE